MRLAARPASAADWIRTGLWVFYLLMWAGGVGTYIVFGAVRSGEEWTAPLFLALASVIVLAGVRMERAAVLLLAGLLGFLAEWIGLRTGALFGEYRYTEALAPAVLGVPVVMISAWLVLVAYADDLLAALPRSSRIVAGAALLTAIDLIIDPLAAGPLGYWTWADAGAYYYGIPAHNFAGWFVVGAVAMAVVQRVPVRRASPQVLWTGGSVVLFFTVLAAANAMVVPACVGVMLCLLHVYIRRTAAGG